MLAAKLRGGGTLNRATSWLLSAGLPCKGRGTSVSLALNLVYAVNDCFVFPDAARRVAVAKTPALMYICKGHTAQDVRGVSYF